MTVSSTILRRSHSLSRIVVVQPFSRYPDSPQYYGSELGFTLERKESDWIALSRPLERTFTGCVCSIEGASWGCLGFLRKPL